MTNGLGPGRTGFGWAVESSVEAYASDAVSTPISDPEAWVGDLVARARIETGNAATSSAGEPDLDQGFLADDETLSNGLRRFLASAGLLTWQDLADADLDRLEETQGLVAWGDRIAHWHAVSRLLVRGVVDRVFDARVLAACEITSAQSLRDARPYELLHRIRQLRDSEEGRRLLATGSDDELSRLCGWVKTLEIARPLHEFGFMSVAEQRPHARIASDFGVLGRSLSLRSGATRACPRSRPDLAPRSRRGKPIGTRFQPRGRTT
ncbi:MAG: DUF4332 domain-containing protein [Pirellulaceae bacterium]